MYVLPFCKYFGRKPLKCYCLSHCQDCVGPKEVKQMKTMFGVKEFCLILLFFGARKEKVLNKCFAALRQSLKLAKGPCQSAKNKSYMLPKRHNKLKANVFKHKLKIISFYDSSSLQAFQLLCSFEFVECFKGDKHKCAN